METISYCVIFIIIAGLFFYVFHTTIDFARWIVTAGADNLRVAKVKIYKWIGIPLIVILIILFLCVLNFVGVEIFRSLGMI